MSVLKYLYYFIALSMALCFASCDSNTSEKQGSENDITPFNVSFEMTTEEIKELYSDCEFQLASANSYDLCGGGEDLYEIVRNGKVLFAFWENWETKKLGGFILLDPEQSYNNLHVGMSLNEYLKIYPRAETTISLLSSKECLFFENGNCWINLDSKVDNYAAEYSFEQGESEFIRYVDTDKNIESIFVKSEG